MSGHPHLGGRRCHFPILPDRCGAIPYLTGLVPRQFPDGLERRDALARAGNTTPAILAEPEP